MTTSASRDSWTLRGRQTTITIRALMARNAPNAVAGIVKTRTAESMETTRSARGKSTLIF